VWACPIAAQGLRATIRCRIVRTPAQEAIKTPVLVATARDRWHELLSVADRCVWAYVSKREGDVTN
jgi:hypothetical protein